MLDSLRVRFEAKETKTVTFEPASSATGAKWLESAPRVNWALAIG